MQRSLFQIENLDCAYRDGPVVLSVPLLNIRQGALVFIVGGSGGGKSTLLETLGLMNRTIKSAVKLSFNAPDGNTFSIHDCWSWEDEKRAQFRQQYFSFIFQQTNLMPNFTAGENMMAPALLTGQTHVKDKILQYMEVLQLPADAFDAKITDLSGGQRQRLAFIRALMASHEVLFGDEPTGNLDRHTAQACLKLLKKELSRSGKTGIIVSHDLSLAVEFADQIVPILLLQTNDRLSGYVDNQQILLRRSEGCFFCGDLRTDQPEEWLTVRMEKIHQSASV
jgi:ABC-type lipoprotein export system ATPase subunit